MQAKSKGVLVGLAVGGLVAVGGWVYQARTAEPAFVVELEERVSRAGHRDVVSTVTTEYHRSDGSMAMVRKEFQPDGKVGWTRRDVFLSSHVRFSAWDDLRLVTAQRERVEAPHPGRPRVEPKSECIQTRTGQAVFERSGQDEMIAGQRAVRVRPLHSGTRALHEMWLAPALGCMELKTVTQFADYPDQAAGRTERVAKWVRIGEPEAAMFAPPEGYEQAKPSEILHRMVERAGAKLTQAEETMLARADAEYANKRVDVNTLR